MHHPAIAPLHTAVVIGGATGIGLAAAKRFLEMGLKVAIVDRRMEELVRAHEALVALAGEEEGRIVAAACDVSDREGLAKTAQHIEATLGPVHVLMNNAGIQPAPPSSASRASGTRFFRSISAASSTARAFSAPP